VPTLFFNSLDDPLVLEDGIDFEGFKQNKNVMLVTTSVGGHIGYNCGLFGIKQRWVTGLFASFLDGCMGEG